MATHTFPLPHDQIANERLKRHWSQIFWTALLLATGAHLALFQLFPTITVPDVSYSASELRTVEMPPEVKIPPPPAAIARPAVPVVSADATIDDAITIAPTTFADNPVENLPPPPTTSGDPQQLEQAYQMFVPSMTAPELLNREQVARAVLANYPSLLRDAGIGGQVRLHVWIDDKGNTVKAAVVATSGQAALDSAALKVVDQMRFRPARNRDVPARVIVELPVEFVVAH